MATEDDPRWLDDEEMAAWLSLMGMLLVVPAHLDAQMQEIAGLTQFEYLILARLSEDEHHTMRISDLAGQWFGSLSRLSHLVKRLEQRGWVRREPDPQDGRYTNAILTDAGWDLVVATAPQQLDLVRRLVLDPLSRAQLRQVTLVAESILAANVPDAELRRAQDRPTGRSGSARPAAADPESADPGSGNPRSGTSRSGRAGSARSKFARFARPCPGGASDPKP